MQSSEALESRGASHKQTGMPDGKLLRRECRTGGILRRTVLAAVHYHHELRSFVNSLEPLGLCISIVRRWGIFQEILCNRRVEQAQGRQD